MDLLIDIRVRASEREFWRVVQLQVATSTWHRSTANRTLLEAGRPALWSGIGRPMARRTILWCGLVEEDGLCTDDPSELVALCAADILVRPAQRERSPLLVIEQRGLPLHAVVAFGAASDVRLRELLPMNVLVAILALSRSGLEIDVDEASLEVGRLVAIAAGRRTMRSQQRELRFRVIEP